MLQEDIQQKGCQVCIKLTKLTARTFFKAIQKLNAYLKKRASAKAAEIPSGKQSVKELVGQGQGVSSIEMDVVKGFDKTARKYGIDYAVRKNDQGKYLIFFKGRDADALTAAIKEFTSSRLKEAHTNGERTSVRESLAQLKKRIKTAVERIKDRKLEAINR